MELQVFNLRVEAGRQRGVPRWRAGVHRVIGFISETSRAFDPAALVAQKTKIDAAADVAGVPVESYLIEMSPPRSGVLWTPAVIDLLCSARAGGLDAVVLEHVDRLSDERDAALLAAVTFSEFGVLIIEARCASTIGADAIVAETPAFRAGKHHTMPASVSS